MQPKKQLRRSRSVAVLPPYGAFLGVDMLKINYSTCSWMLEEGQRCRPPSFHFGQRPITGIQIEGNQKLKRCIIARSSRTMIPTVAQNVSTSAV